MQKTGTKEKKNVDSASDIALKFHNPVCATGVLTWLVK